MLNRSAARGLLLLAIAVVFGSGALRYPIGQLGRPGPGLFPLLLSGLLLVLAVVTLVQARLARNEVLYVNLKNIGLVMLALGAFVALSRLAGMALGIVALVFITALTGTAYSWKRGVVVSAGLVAIALAFQNLLGLNLRLF